MKNNTQKFNVNKQLEAFLTEAICAMPPNG
jgi:hypothetical protein